MIFISLFPEVPSLPECVVSQLDIIFLVSFAAWKLGVTCNEVVGRSARFRFSSDEVDK